MFRGSSIRCLAPVHTLPSQVHTGCHRSLHLKHTPAQLALRCNHNPEYSFDVCKVHVDTCSRDHSRVDMGCCLQWELILGNLQVQSN